MGSAKFLSISFHHQSVTIIAIQSLLLLIFDNNSITMISAGIIGAWDTPAGDFWAFSSRIVLQKR
ncbi:hypothetical protein RE476_07480 [Methanolobus mangrovi]|uniref:Uncharacterized protein n=1 Tax=Methanolobus mangrovi TaxID=3072977 RepID=A0AA51UE18_9EURY|nr:hypothetical protein [Methanolobus mangrovi]WMW21249.1 hypothetical protein RE476_07480 [Methanolobus mangrovi]